MSVSQSIFPFHPHKELFKTLFFLNCGSWAQSLHGMWDLPRPGLEPVSPALSGRFSTTAPPGKPRNMFFGFFLINLFIFGCIGSLLLRAGFLQLQCAGFSLRWLLLLWSTGSRRAGSRGQAQQLWHTGLVAPQHVGSSRTRDRTHVPCIGRRMLNHCATREVPETCFLK